MKQLPLVVTFLYCLSGPTIGWSQSNKMTLDSLVRYLNQQDFPEHLSISSRIPKQLKVRTDLPPSSPTTSMQRLLDNAHLRYRQVGNNVIITGEKSFYISGYVRDAHSGEALIGAHVYTDLGQGVATDNQGYYQLEISPGAVVLSCSYLGYKLHTQELHISHDQLVSLALTTDFSLPSITISTSNDRNQIQSSGHEVPLSDLVALPMSGTSLDLTHYLQLQSGVTTGADGLGGLHVRGGSADQNLYLLDGIP
nr:carboxypeptidase-like regulatory domain-containing protein [Saprospiraceae bacterium]